MGSEYKTVEQVKTIPLVSRNDAYEYARLKALFSSHGHASEFMSQMFAFKKQYRTHFRAGKSKRLGFNPNTINGQSDTINQTKLRNYLIDLDANYIVTSEIVTSGTPTTQEKAYYAVTNGIKHKGYDGTISNYTIEKADPLANYYYIKELVGNNHYDCYMADENEPDDITIEFNMRKTSDNSVLHTFTYSSSTFDSNSLIIQYNVDSYYGVVARWMIAEHGELPIYDDQEIDIMPIVPFKELNKIMGVDDSHDIIENTEATDYFLGIQTNGDTKRSELMNEFNTLLIGYGDNPVCDNKYSNIGISEPEFEGGDETFKNSLIGLYGRKYSEYDTGSGLCFEAHVGSPTTGQNATSDFLEAYKIKKAEYEALNASAKKDYYDNGGKALARNHERFLRSLNLNYVDFKKTLGNNKVDSVYLTIGIDLFSEYEGAVKILFDYFDFFPQGNQETKISDLDIKYEYSREVGTYANKRIIADLDYKFEYEDMNGVTSSEIMTGTALDRDKLEKKKIKLGWLPQDTVKSDYGYITNKRGWVQKGLITSMELINRDTEPVEVGVADKKLIGRYTSFTDEEEYTVNNVVTTQKVIKFYHQVDANNIDYIFIRNFKQTYSFGAGSDQTSGVNTPSKSDFEGFRIVPHVNALRTLNYKDFEAVYETSLIMLIYTYDRVKLKWYQTSWFGAILKIIEIAAIIYTLGTSTDLVILFEHMIYAALISYAVGEIAKAIGGELGMALAVGAGIALSLAVPGSEEITLSQVLMVSLNYMDIALKAETEKIISDTRSMIDGYDEKIKEIKEKTGDLAGYGLLDSDSIAEIMKEWNEDITDYFIVHRTPNMQVYNQMDVISQAKTVQPLLDAAWAPLNSDNLREIRI